MRSRRFDHWPCPIARSADLIGDPWVLMILRECTYGVSRFDAFQERLSIGRNVLTSRLARMVESGLLEKVRYQERPERFEYRLTEKGADATGVLAWMISFGERWIFEDEAQPIELRDRRTGARVHPQLVDARTGEPLNARNLVPAPGPGFPGDDAVRDAWFAPAELRRGGD